MQKCPHCRTPLELLGHVSNPSGESTQLLSCKRCSRAYRVNPQPQNIWLKIGQKVWYRPSESLLPIEGTEQLSGRTGMITDIMGKPGNLVMGDDPKIPFESRDQVELIIDGLRVIDGQQIDWIVDAEDPDTDDSIFPKLVIGDIVYVSPPRDPKLGQITWRGEAFDRPKVVTGIYYRHREKAKARHASYEDLANGNIIVEINWNERVPGEDIRHWYDMKQLLPGDEIEYWSEIDEPSFESGTLIEAKTQKTWNIDRIGSIVWMEPKGTQMIASRSIPAHMKDEFLFYPMHGNGQPFTGNQIKQVTGPFIKVDDHVRFVTNDGNGPVDHGHVFEIRNYFSPIIKGLEHQNKENLQKLPWDYTRGSNKVMVGIRKADGTYELVKGKNVFPYYPNDDKDDGITPVQDFPPDPGGNMEYVMTRVPIDIPLPQKEELEEVVEDIRPVQEVMEEIIEDVQEIDEELELVWDPVTQKYKKKRKKVLEEVIYA